MRLAWLIVLVKAGADASPPPKEQTSHHKDQQKHRQSIPPSGVKVLHGRTGQVMACIKPGDEGVTAIGDDLIVVQCCDQANSMQCRRFLPSLGDTARGCFGGKKGARFRPTTYAEAYAVCALHNFSLCTEAGQEGGAQCAQQGCGYSVYSWLWTDVPCAPANANGSPGRGGGEGGGGDGGGGTGGGGKVAGNRNLILGLGCLIMVAGFVLKVAPPNTHARTRTRTHTRTHARTHTHTHTHAHARAHTRTRMVLTDTGCSLTHTDTWC